MFSEMAFKMTLRSHIKHKKYIMCAEPQKDRDRVQEDFDIQAHFPHFNKYFD